MEFTIRKWLTVFLLVVASILALAFETITVSLDPLEQPTGTKPKQNTTKPDRERYVLFAMVTQLNLDLGIDQRLLVSGS